MNKKTDKKALGKSNTKAHTKCPAKAHEKCPQKVVKKSDVDIPDEMPEGVTIPEDIDEAPRDLRGNKPAGRPTNAERSKTSAIDEKTNLLIADIIGDIQKARSDNKLSLELEVKLLPQLLNHMVRDDDQEDESELTMTILGKKYLNEQKKVKAATLAARGEIQIHIAKVKGNAKHTDAAE